MEKQRDEIDSLIKTVVDKWGTVDILVNNAGITRDTLMMRMKPEQVIYTIVITSLWGCTCGLTFESMLLCLFMT